MPFKNYYKILGVSPSADEQTIRRKFRELARQYHPDVNKTANPARFHEINEAYQVLTDVDKRARFDRDLRERNTIATRGGGASSAYVRPERPAPSGRPAESHRRPADPEPVHGPVHDLNPTSLDAFAGLGLLLGVVTCAVVAFALVQVVNLLAGEGITVRNAPTLTSNERATVTAEWQDRATLNAIPTLPPRQAFNLTTAPLTENDPLFTVVQGGIPALNDVCDLTIGDTSTRCDSPNLRSISSGMANTAVIGLEFDRPTEATALRRAIFVIDFGSTPRGISVNIGDSRKNNATGGRASAGDPRYNAEIVIQDGDLYIYGYSATCTELASTLLHYEPDVVSSGSRLYLEVQDQVIRWIDEGTFEVKRLESSCGFAIGGQTFEREQTDNQIYAAFNRAIQSGTTQTGGGVSKVRIIMAAGSE